MTSKTQNHALPPETLLRIFKFVKQPDDVRPELTADLIACALVCVDWHRAFELFVMVQDAGDFNYWGRENWGRENWGRPVISRFASLLPEATRLGVNVTSMMGHFGFAITTVLRTPDAEVCQKSPERPEAEDSVEDCVSLFEEIDTENLRRTVLDDVVAKEITDIIRNIVPLTRLHLSFYGVAPEAAETAAEFLRQFYDDLRGLEFLSLNHALPETVADPVHDIIRNAPNLHEISLSYIYHSDAMTRALQSRADIHTVHFTSWPRTDPLNSELSEDDLEARTVAVKTTLRGWANLRSLIFKHDTSHFCDVLEELTTSCPLLEDLTFTSGEWVEEDEEDVADALVMFLEIAAPRLIRLEQRHSIPIDERVFSMLAESATKLEHLMISQFVEPPEEKWGTVWPRLRSLELDPIPSVGFLRHMLRGCPRLEAVSLRKMEQESADVLLEAVSLRKMEQESADVLLEAGFERQKDGGPFLSGDYWKRVVGGLVQ